MKALIKNTGIMGSTQLVLVIISILRTKYLAVKIGPEGYGLYSLLDGFFQLGSIFTGAALADASIKYIAENRAKGDMEKVQSIFDFSFSFIFIAVSFVSTIFMVFYSFFKEYFLSNEVVFMYYAFFAAAFIGTTLSNFVFAPLLTSYSQIKKIATINIFTSIFNLVSVVVLIYFFHLTGFFINAALTALFSLFLFWKSGKNIIKVRLSWPDFKSDVSNKLMSFFSMNFLLGITWMGSSYLQRILVVSQINIASLGLYSAAASLNKYMGMVIEAAKFHTYPILCEDVSTEQKNKALNEYFRLSLLYSSVLSCFMINLAPIAIILFYSKAFSSLSSVFYIFVIAQLLANISWAYTWTIVGMAKMKFYTFATLITHGIVVIIPLLFLKKYGILSIGIGLIVSALQQMIFIGIYLWVRYKLGIDKKNFYLFVIVLLILTLNVLFRNYGMLYNMLILTASCTVLFFTFTQAERKSIITIIKRRTGLVK